MDTSAMVMISTQNSPVQLVITVTAFSIGLVAVYIALRLNRQFGGKIRVAMTYFILGVLTNALSIVLSHFFGHEYSVFKQSIDLHNVLMGVGMIFFTFSAYKFSLLLSRE